MILVEKLEILDNRTGLEDDWEEGGVLMEYVVFSSFESFLERVEEKLTGQRHFDINDDGEIILPVKPGLLPEGLKDQVGRARVWIKPKQDLLQEKRDLVMGLESRDFTHIKNLHHAAKQTYLFLQRWGKVQGFPVKHMDLDFDPRTATISWEEGPFEWNAYLSLGSSMLTEYENGEPELNLIGSENWYVECPNAYSIKFYPKG